MNTIICLIWNTDCDSRHWVRNGGEDKTSFISRIKRCYSDSKYVLDFYEAKLID